MNIIVASSGGPTCAINASIAGVWREASECPAVGKVYGALNGIEGIMQERIIDLADVLKSDADVELLKKTPASILGSCRCKLPPSDSLEIGNRIYDDILAVLNKYKIEVLLYIGGNDSMDTVSKLSAYLERNNSGISVIGIPKTIDNDLPETDHTPGFGSAARYLVTTIREIARDSMVYNCNSVTIIEVMGRDTGWLAASACVLNKLGDGFPHLIYLPETPFSYERFLADIQEKQRRHKAVIALVSEGVKTDGGTYAAADRQSGKQDIFGHSYLSGIGKLLEELVGERLNCKVRSVELNVLQRCSAHLASDTDIAEAELVGEEAFAAGLDGHSGVMVVLLRCPFGPKGSYSVYAGRADVDLVANKIKYFPKEWINPAGNHVTGEAAEYFMPLIGDINTLPEHLTLDKRLQKIVTGV